MPRETAVPSLIRYLREGPAHESAGDWPGRLETMEVSPLAMQNPKRIYLDVCTLCRPFDDQRQLRIRLETDAVYLILDCVARGQYAMMVSPAHYVEIRQTAQFREEAEVHAYLTRVGIPGDWDLPSVRRRAEGLHEIGFGIADAVHVAFAEASADVLITCDDQLLRKCVSRKVKVACANPVQFILMEGLP